MAETEETTSTIPFSSWFWKIWVIILSSLAIFVGSIHFLDLDGVQSLHSNIPLHLKPFRPLPIRIANYIGRFLKQTHLLNVILPLNEDTLIRDACKQLTFTDKEVCPLLSPIDIDSPNDIDEEWKVGLSPNDIDEEWKVGLRVLLHSLETDAKLTLFGRFFATQQIGDALKRRALVSQYWEHNTEWEKEIIERPVFIVGLPRTGTTFLQELLEQDISLR